MNRLQFATSPYLLQHAHNPVDWYEWGPEPLQRARTENKPIFLSIGYAACHWCHVMAHESFEDVGTASLMNERFINIKVDREQRPDLDNIYMSATVSLTGSGGWPMSVFLTPDLQPFYAGTYFPHESRYNLPAFRDVLTSLAGAWAEEHEHVLEVSGQITAHLREQGSLGVAGEMPSEEQLDGAAQRLYGDYDWGFGGWGGAPKFPQPMTIEFLLRRGLTQAGKGLEPEPPPAAGQEGSFLKPALHALRAMARGGMYDVVGGGFSRYSTDIEWRVPHFEKMLYDNAQLALVYLHAWQITAEPFFRRISEETLDFVMRELLGPEGGFWSSLDADSEGEEGRFYLWSFDEIKTVLGDELEFFKAAYFVSPQGNWQGRIILQRALDDATLAARFKLSPPELAARLRDCHARLLAARAKRVRPGTDDKVLTAWNGLMLSAFAQAARFLAPPGGSGDAQMANPAYLDCATRNADFLLTSLWTENGLRRAWRGGTASGEVFLEDYAALICGLLDLYETDFNNRWFAAALALADEMVRRFDDPVGGFFDTPVDGETLLLRPKDMQDSATPCGNSLAIDGLLRLAAFTGRSDFRTKAEHALGIIASPALRVPTAFGRWLQAADFARAGVKEIAIIGPAGDSAREALIQEVRRDYHPHAVVAVSPEPVPDDCPPLLMDRPMLNGQATAYVCQDFVCRQPITTAEALRGLL